MGLLLAAVVSFTTPCYNADSTRCGVLDLWPIADLDSVYLLGQTRFQGGAPDTLRRKAASPPCEPDSFAFDDRGEAWTVFVLTRDRAGNFSCPSNLVGLGPWPVGVEPIVTPIPARVEFFDLSGRRVRAPLANGYYWRRETSAQGSVMIRWVRALNGRVVVVR